MSYSGRGYNSFIMMQLFLIMLFMLHIYVAKAVDNRENRLFKYKSYDEMVETMSKLAEAFPDLVDLHVAQDRYKLSSPGLCGSKRIPCKQYFLTITNKTNLDVFDDYGKSNSNSSNSIHNIYSRSSRPQVFFSGEIHGDERVGPHAMIELALLLVHGSSYKGDGRDHLKLYSSDNLWLRHLVNSRVIIIMPMTNSIGYSESTREENGIDT